MSILRGSKASFFDGVFQDVLVTKLHVIRVLSPNLASLLHPIALSDITK